MKSKEWREWQERSRPGEWAGPIIADLERSEALLREARELAKNVQEECSCRCDVAYTSRGMHGPDCMDYMAVDARALLSRMEAT